MPWRVYLTVMLTVIGAAGPTVAAVTQAGVSVAAVSVVALLAAAALRLLR